MSSSSLKNIVHLLEAQNNELSVEACFLHDLQRSIEMTNNNNDRKPSRTYKPSGMNCIRASYYEISGKESKSYMDYAGVGICNSGTDTHVRIQTAISQMKDNNIDCEYVDVEKFVKSRKLDYLDIKSHSGMETKLYHKKLNMSFMCDGIIKYKGKYYILELKTESSNKFFNREGVDPSHFQQAIAYSLSLGLDDVMFIYISRDNSTMKSYMFHVTDDMKQSLISYIEECDSYLKKKKTPPKPENVSRKTCEWCNYKSLCRSEV